jgi:type VI secretion system protein ImpG
MFSKYYSRELRNLRNLSKEFSLAHPSLAPMLEGTSQDPDVERLLEGTAYIAGMLREKIDDEFPELTQSLFELTFPHYLRPLPSATVLSFTPKPNLMEKISVKKNSKIQSVKIDDENCIFSTTNDIDVFPAYISDVSTEKKPGQDIKLTVKIKLKNINLSGLKIKSFNLFINEAYDEASDIFFALQNHLKKAELTTENSPSSSKYILDPEKIKPGGFDEKSSLIPYPEQAHKAYRILQEYFMLPEKFLFLEIQDFDAFAEDNENNEFEISFYIEKLNNFKADINKNSFLLFAVPGINLFDHDAAPVSVDHKQSEYKINPTGYKNNRYEIFSIEKVSGYTQGSASKKEYYSVFDSKKNNENAGTYSVKRRLSSVTNQQDIYISTGYASTDKMPDRETLSISLLCSSGDTAKMLQTGDICLDTSTSPELCTFRNITPPTSPLRPSVTRDLWKYMSHLSLNLMNIMDENNLKELLSLYIFPESRDQKNVKKTEKKIESISGLKKENTNILYKGSVLRGQKIIISANSGNFASKGDFYIFGSVLNNFFSGYSAINSFTQLILQDDLTGEEFIWAPKPGEKQVL